MTVTFNPDAFPAANIGALPAHLQPFATDLHELLTTMEEFGIEVIPQKRPSEPAVSIKELSARYAKVTGWPTWVGFKPHFGSAKERAGALAKTAERFAIKARGAKNKTREQDFHRLAARANALSVNLYLNCKDGVEDSKKAIERLDKLVIDFASLDLFAHMARASGMIADLCRDLGDQSEARRIFDNAKQFWMLYHSSVAMGHPLTTTPENPVDPLTYFAHWTYDAIKGGPSAAHMLEGIAQGLEVIAHKYEHDNLIFAKVFFEAGHSWARAAWFALASSENVPPLIEQIYQAMQAWRRSGRKFHGAFDAEADRRLAIALTEEASMLWSKYASELRLREKEAASQEQ